MNKSQRITGLMVCGLAVVVLMPLGCGDDSPTTPAGDGSAFLNLTQKWHVLNNIEVAYNKRDLTKYDALLDDNFTFFLSPGDVGGSIPSQWGRADEILYNSRLFDPNYSGAHRCRSIEMDLNLPDDKSTIPWTEITPASAPDETWYSTTVFYRFRFEMDPDTHFESVAGAKGEFAVRNAGTPEQPHWQLVEFRDLAEK